MNLFDITKIFHTIGHLRTKQMVYQLYYRVNKTASLKSSKHHTHGIRSWNQPWSAPPFATPLFTNSGELCIFNESIQMDTNIDWNDPRRTKLWLYNLHYFDVLNATDADKHIDLLNTWIERWIHENPPYIGDGWAPYTLSLRIVNLIKWFSRHRSHVKPEWIISLGVQTEALLKQLEYHILANHLFANAKALIFSGTFFEGPRADTYLQKGLKILKREVEEQFLQDGGHFELSPMYHSILLWDMCDLVNLADRSNISSLKKERQKWLHIVEKALSWLCAMLHPDGEISFFNDSALNVAPSADRIALYAQQVGVSPSNTTKHATGVSARLLPDSGYCAVTLARGGKAILDVAKIGPDYQPGHAHADTLSFELSLFNQRFLVNSGTSTYTLSPQRQTQRSTKAHNTVCIDNKNSSEVWSAFRVAKRAYPQNLRINQAANQVTIRCSHDGYARLAGKNLHIREWHFSDQTLVVRDSITGSYGNAELHLYFHPSISILFAQNRVECRLPEGQTAYIMFVGAQQILLEPSQWHPQFGVTLDNQCLVVTFKSNELITRMEW